MPQDRDDRLANTSGQLRIGQPVRRLEDDALLTGAARYIDDLDLPQLKGSVVQALYAQWHAWLDGAPSAFPP